jgi:thiosulfate/3-mercaptopyruvate sulfurtransferase
MRASRQILQKPRKTIAQHGVKLRTNPVSETKGFPMRRSFSTVFLAAGASLLASTAIASDATPLVDTGWLTANLANDSVVVLDIRNVSDEADPFVQGHIPGSVAAAYNQVGWRTEIDGTIGLLPELDDIQVLIESLGVDNDEHVVIAPVGASSSDFGAATRVYWTFKVLGHDNVSILDGGYAAWTRDGGSLSTDATSVEPGTFEVALRDELLATSDEVASAIDAGLTLVDGRPEAQFTGAEKSGVVARAGTLPGAVNLEQARLYSTDDAAYASADLVETIAAEVGVDTAEPAITFCNTGHWASVVWFGLSEVAGQENVAMYDGSMVQWAADPARPVVNGALN